jgi:hypothetical protein
MLRFLLVTLVLVAGCSKDNSPRGLCTRGCKKALACLPGGEAQQDSCVDACVAQPPDQARVEKLEAMSCDELGASLGGAGGLGGAPSAPGGATPTRPANGCTADCRTCVGDGNSCWAAAGGTNGIPCDPCCCAPGGPAPTWRTNADE